MGQAPSRFSLVLAEKHTAEIPKGVLAAREGVLRLILSWLLASVGEFPQLATTEKTTCVVMHLATLHSIRGSRDCCVEYKLL